MQSAVKLGKMYNLNMFLGVCTITSEAKLKSTFFEKKCLIPQIPLGNFIWKESEKQKIQKTLISAFASIKAYISYGIFN